MASDFTNKITTPNQEKNGNDSISNLSGSVSELSSILRQSKMEFERFDISNSVNSESLSSIGESESGKAILDVLGEMREKSDTSLSEQLVANKTLSDVKTRIEKSNTLSEEQKKLLLTQVSYLKNGFKTSNVLVEQAKKSMAQYSDVAVAGITSFLGNSPLTLFMSKMVTDQAKAIFARRKEVKANNVKLLKAEEIDKQKLSLSEQTVDSSQTTADESETQTSMMKMSRKIKMIMLGYEKIKGKVAQPVRVVSSRAKLKTGAKFESYKTKKPGLLGGLIRVMLLTVSPLISIFGKLGLAARAATAMMSMPKLGGGKGGGGKVGSLLSKAGGLASRVMGPAALVAGAGAAGYGVGSMINSSLLTNKDGSGKIANLFSPSDKGQSDKSNAAADKVAQSKGFKNMDEMRASNKAKQAERLKSLRENTTEKNKINAQAKVNAVGTEREGVESAQNGSPDKSKSPTIINSSSTTNNNQTNVIPPLSPRTPDTTFISMSNKGAI